MKRYCIPLYTHPPLIHVHVVYTINVCGDAAGNATRLHCSSGGGVVVGAVGPRDDVVGPSPRSEVGSKI